MVFSRPFRMLGTSLAMAPACLVGQLCTVVDLDGPVFLKDDRPITVQYADGFLHCPEHLWGGAIGETGQRGTLSQQFEQGG